MLLKLRNILKNTSVMKFIFVKGVLKAFSRAFFDIERITSKIKAFQQRHFTLLGLQHGVTAGSVVSSTVLLKSVAISASFSLFNALILSTTFLYFSSAVSRGDSSAGSSIKLNKSGGSCDIIGALLV